MPAKPKRKSVPRCQGVLAPDRLYTVEGVLKAAGIGHVQLAEARQSKHVTPIYHGRRVYYQGAELIAWIIATGESTPVANRQQG